MNRKIKLPKKDQVKIKHRYTDFCTADRKLYQLEKQFRTCAAFSLVMFVIFSYGMMEPIELRELLSEAVIKAVQLSLFVGVGLAIYLLNKKTKTTTDRFNLANELQKTWGLMIDTDLDNNYIVTMATAEVEGRWQIMEFDLMQEESYEEISVEEWIKLRDSLP